MKTENVNDLSRHKVDTSRGLKSIDADWLMPIYKVMTKKEWKNFLQKQSIFYPENLLISAFNKTKHILERYVRNMLAITLLIYSSRYREMH